MVAPEPAKFELLVLEAVGDPAVTVLVNGELDDMLKDEATRQEAERPSDDEGHARSSLSNCADREVSQTESGASVMAVDLHVKQSEDDLQRSTERGRPRFAERCEKLGCSGVVGCSIVERCTEGLSAVTRGRRSSTPHSYAPRTRRRAHLASLSLHSSEKGRSMPEITRRTLRTPTASTEAG